MVSDLWQLSVGPEKSLRQQHADHHCRNEEQRFDLESALVIVLTKGKIEEPEAVKADREELTKAAAAGDAEAIRALEEDPLAQPQGEGLGQARLPFGPFLILAMLEYLFLGDSLIDWYGGLLGLRCENLRDGPFRKDRRLGKREPISLPS